MEEINNLSFKKINTNLLDLLLSLMGCIFLPNSCCCNLYRKKILTTFNAKLINTVIVPTSQYTPFPYISPIFNTSLCDHYDLTISDQGRNTILVRNGGKYIIFPKIGSIEWTSYLPNGIGVVGITIYILLSIDDPYRELDPYAVSTIACGSAATTQGIAYDLQFTWAKADVYIDTSFPFNYILLPLIANSNISFRIKLGITLTKNSGVTDTNFVSVILNKLQLEFIKIS